MNDLGKAGMGNADAAFWEKARAHLFQAFQGSARKGGTGLGLAVAQELVAAHGGTIRLLEIDNGAAFEIDIPDRGGT